MVIYHTVQVMCVGCTPFVKNKKQKAVTVIGDNFAKCLEAPWDLSFIIITVFPLAGTTRMYNQSIYCNREQLKGFSK